MLVVIAAVAAFTLHQVSTSDGWVDHTHDVINNNQQLLSDVKDAQSAERGYIITGDESYLNPYHSAADDIPRVLSRLLQFTADNPAQQQRLKTLAGLIAQRIAVLDEAVRQRRENGFDAAQAVVVAGQGRIVMDQIRNAGQAIENEEYDLLRQRQEARRGRIQDGFIATVAAALLALIALVLAPIDVRRSAAQRDAALRIQRESESTTRAIFQSAAQGILMVDGSGRIVSANPAMGSLFGYSEEELVGQPIEMLLPEKLRGGHVAHRSSYFAAPQNRPMGVGLDLQARRKDGSEFYAEISLSYVITAHGTLAVAFVSDISKRKTDEQAIRHQREELRTLAARLMTAQDDERRRIARDLHDDLSQKLAYLAMDIGKLANKPTSPDSAADLRPLQRRAAEAADTVRRISHQLHPSILDDIGLEAALEQSCEEFQERSGIHTHFSSHNIPESLSRDVAGSLFHIFQECLRNVSKHSQTEEVYVALELVDGNLCLTVRDEGVGLRTAQLKSGKSIGIVGMQERAHLVNGIVSIESEQGEGTQVTVQIPLSRAG